MPDGRDRDAATPPVEAAAATDRSSAAESAFAAVKAERFLTDREAILVVTRDLGANGTALLALNLCAFLKRRHNVVLLALAGGPLMEAARQAATVVVALAQATGGRDGALRASMLAAARTFEPSYAIVNGIPDAPLLQGLVHGGTPPVLLLHDRPADETLAQCLSLASLVITPSPALAKGAEDMGGRIETIPPAASQIRMPISVDVRRAEAWRARRDMRPGGNRRAFVVLVHCPSGDQAGIGKMLRLARALADTPARRHLRLVWHVTDETNRAAMDALLAREGATETPRVSVGVCSETAPGEVALAFADAVLLLPPYSGVPMAALQALGRGIPVITIGGESWFAEMLRGEAGLAYCAAGDDGLDTVAAVVRHLAEDRSRYLAAAAAARSLAQARLGMPGYVAAVHRAATAAAQTWRNERPSVAIRGGDPAIAAYRTLDVPWSADPVVSIIVPVHGNFAFTYACIRSIVETQPRTPLEVIIVDDCSTDETVHADVVLRNCRIIRQERNLGFVRSCNHGAAEARGSFLFFLNNDTTLLPDAVDALVDTLARRSDAGVVGAKLLFPDGKLQEAGGLIWRAGDGWNYGRGDDPDDPRYNYVRAVDYVSGAALMVRRELFHRLGGFDTHYAPAYYEDTDLAFRARAAGYKVLYQPRARVVHFEGVTSGIDLGSGVKRYQTVNESKFFERWKTTLEAHAPNGTTPEIEKDRDARFRVLFVDETTPTPKEDAGSNAALTHMLCLQTLGGKVTFVPADNMSHLGAASTALQDLGIEFVHHPFCWSVEEILRKRPDEFDVIYLHRLNIAARYLSLCRALAPRARIVYNVADLHHLRLAREHALAAPDPRGDALVRTARDTELLLARLADTVIVHSSVERQVLLDAGIANVLEVPWIIETRPPPAGPAGRKGLCFVGGFRHRPNADAVAWFVDAVWPLVRQERPQETFHVIGSHMPPAVWALERHDGVRCHGFVEDLDPVLDAIRITVAPLRYGAGLKGKVALSLAHGIPCVGTSIAYEGFEGAEPGLMQVADDPRAMADRVIALLRDDALWSQASASALACAGRTLSSAAVGRILRRIVPSTSDNSQEKT